MSNIKYSDCPAPLKDFLYYMLTIRGRSPKTVDAYYIDLRTFLRYIKLSKLELPSATDFQQIAIADVSLDLIKSISLPDIYAYLDYVYTQRGNNPKARLRKISSIRSFFKYLTHTVHLLEENPVKNMDMPSAKKAMPKYLTLEESIELVTHVDTAFSQRDYCILTLFLNCGMRLSELVGIDIPNIRENTVKLLGKGNKERIVYLNDACLHAIEQYMQVRKPGIGGDKNALFTSNRGTRLSPRRVEQIVAECLRSAGLSGQGYSPHKLRHTAATLMYQHGNVDIRALKEILGHENLSTTEIYTHVANRQIEEAANRSPLSGIKVNPLQNKTQKNKPEE